MPRSMKRATVVILILLVVTPVLAQQPQPEDQLPAAPLLVTAYSFVWLALFGYLVSVAQRLSKVQREVERLESDMKRGTRG